MANNTGQPSPYVKKKSNSLRVPPQSIESEKALLGSIMLRPVAMNDVIDVVSADSFYAEKHKVIFQGMQELYKKREPIDLVSLTAKLTEKHDLESVGGASYLAELTNTVPSSTNVKHYAEIVGKKFSLRNLISAGDYLTELGFNEHDDIEDVMDRAEKSVFEITGNVGHGQKFIGIKEILPAVWETMEKLQDHKGELRGVPTGFKGLDNKLSGLMESDLIILAARPSTGKTALALNIARQSALRHNIPVGIFSLEMGSQQLVDRMLASESRVDAWKMRTGQALNENDFLRIRDAMDRLSSAPIYIDDKPGNTLLQMRSTARRLKSQYGLGLLIVDYLQLITTSKNYDSMVNQVTEISRGLKSLARELKVPVLALSQLSRAVESRGGKPRLSDLRDSGAIEQDADVVMFIHREKDEEAGRSNATQILIEKHRNGPTGVVDLYFDVDKQAFLDVEKDNFDSFGSTEGSHDHNPFQKPQAAQSAPEPQEDIPFSDDDFADF